MEKLKNVGAGPVSAQKEVIDNCPEVSKRNKAKAHEMQNLHSNFKGITLIALIITIIVMLILVGVTITVALNGGLFETATNAATGTQKEAERERLIEIALANYNVAEGKITDANDLANKIQSSLGLKKSDKTTDSKLVIEGKNILWQIDLSTAEVEEYEEKQSVYIKLSQINEKGETTFSEKSQFAGNKAFMFSIYECFGLLGRSYVEETFLSQFAKHRGFNSWDESVNDPSTDPDAGIYESVPFTFKYKDKADEGTLDGEVTASGLAVIGATNKCYNENGELIVDIENIEFSIVEFP